MIFSVFLKSKKVCGFKVTITTFEDTIVLQMQLPVLSKIPLSSVHFATSITFKVLFLLNIVVPTLV